MKSLQKRIFAQKMSAYTNVASIEDRDEPSTVCHKAKASLIAFRASKKTKKKMKKKNKETLRRQLLQEHKKADDEHLDTLMGFIVMALIGAGCLSLLPKGLYPSMISSTSTTPKARRSIELPHISIKHPNQIEARKTFYLKTIKKDGNCQYRALAYLESNNEDMWKTIKEKITNELLTNLSKYILVDSAAPEFLNEHLNDATWGGNQTLFAYSLYEERKIYLYEKDSDNWIKFNEEKIFTKDPFYIQRVNSNHYEALIPA